MIRNRWVVGMGRPEISYLSYSISGCAVFQPKLNKLWKTAEKWLFCNVFGQFWVFFEVYSILTEKQRTKPNKLTSLKNFASFGTYHTGQKHYMTPVEINWAHQTENIDFPEEFRFFWYPYGPQTCDNSGEIMSFMFWDFVVKAPSGGFSLFFKMKPDVI